VLGNNKISAEEIIAVSGIEKEQNMFKTSMRKATIKIKENPYVAEVKITRNLDGVIDIHVTERVATLMMQVDNEYVYINNQGYILEISEIPLEIPILVGIKTADLNLGNRLEREDLIKLDTVIKIIAAASNNNIANLITTIDVSNNKEYILNLETEQKVVHFGDDSKINQKILWIVSILEQEIGIPGEIFLENVDKVVFREKV